MRPLIVYSTLHIPGVRLYEQNKEWQTKKKNNITDDKYTKSRILDVAEHTHHILHSKRPK